MQIESAEVTLNPDGAKVYKYIVTCGDKEYRFQSDKVLSIDDIKIQVEKEEN